MATKRPTRPASLTGAAHLLAEATFGAFHTALDNLPDDLPRGAAGMETLRHDLRRLMALFAMVEQVYQAATRPAA
jgi:hypothetical protein